MTLVTITPTLHATSPAQRDGLCLDGPGKEYRELPLLQLSANACAISPGEAGCQHFSIIPSLLPQDSGSSLYSPVYSCRLEVPPQVWEMENTEIILICLCGRGFTQEVRGEKQKLSALLPPSSMLLRKSVTQRKLVTIYMSSFRAVVQTIIPGKRLVVRTEL